MLPRLVAALRRRHGRAASAVVLALGLLAQSVALPWHLAVAHHGHHGDAGDDGHRHGHGHEHPNLPTDHDEDDHEYSSVLAGALTRARVVHDELPAQPFAIPAVDEQVPGIRCSRAASEDGAPGSPQGPPAGAVGARGPPTEQRTLPSVPR